MKIAEINVTANVCKHFVAEKCTRKRNGKTFDVGWRACQLKRMERSFYPVKEIPRELQF
jgi:hypothetical protein